MRAPPGDRFHLFAEHGDMTLLSDASEAHALAQTLARFLGPEIMRAFEDDDVTEIYVNPDGALWLHSRARGRHNTRLTVQRGQALSFLNAVAASLDKTVNADYPTLQAELPQPVFRGARLQAEIPPVVAGPSFNVRKPPTRIYPLDSYVTSGALAPGYYRALRYAVREHWNIVVCGPTHSGKTTFLNALIQEMVAQFPQERFVILEDTAELQCAAPDVLQMRSGPAWSLADLVKITLRRSPDRIIVGEVRDEAALHLLDSWATGHPGGCASLHASSPEGALQRLDRLCQRANVPSQAALIAEAVNLVVVIRPTATGRRITDLARVEGLDEQGQYRVTRLPEEGVPTTQEKLP